MATQSRRRRDYERLKIMTGYCKTTRCLRGYILDYFGQPHAEECGNCGNCRRTYRLEDITISAQMILSCVVRVRETLGYYVGKTLIVQTLRGSRDRRLLQLGLDRLSTYGLMRKLSAEKVLAMVDRLEEAGYLRTNAQHFTLEPAAAANGVLFGGEKIAMPVHAKRREKTPPEERGGIRLDDWHGRSLRGAQGGAHAPCRGGGRACLCCILQRDARGHGGESPAHDGGFSGGLRRRRDKSRALRRSVPESHRRIRRSGRSLKKGKPSGIRFGCRRACAFYMEMRG